MQPSKLQLQDMTSHPSSFMHIRTPDIGPDQGTMIWSKIPEFSLAYNGYSVVIPHVEYYLNNTMNQVRRDYGKTNPQLDDELKIFIRQEIHHSRYHNQFNKRMFDCGIEGLQELVNRVSDDLKKLSETRSFAFNVAYCAGFESIATFDSKYLYERCDQFFEDADPHGANLLLWHVAEEFEHRCVCHDAFVAVSGSYFVRMHGLLYAFWHIGGAFLQAEELVLKHYHKTLSKPEQRKSRHQSKALFWRQIRYVGPRMLRILVPGYHPRKVKVSARIQRALDEFRAAGPIDVPIIEKASAAV
jgi:predicted metal-dependent hydrolase